MGRTADLIVVQKPITDSLHKEGKPQKVIAEEVGCSHPKHINRKLYGRERPFKSVGDLHKEWTEAGVSASRAITHRRILDMGFKCHIPLVMPLLNNKHQKHLTWAKGEKELVFYSVVQSPLF